MSDMYDPNLDEFPTSNQFTFNVYEGDTVGEAEVVEGHPFKWTVSIQSTGSGTSTTVTRSVDWYPAEDSGMEITVETDVSSGGGKKSTGSVPVRGGDD